MAEITDIKCGLLQSTCFKEHSNMAVVPNHWVSINLHKKQCIPVIKWNKKHSLKQVVLMIYTLAKDFFCSCYF